MSHLFWLDQEHLKRIQHMFPKPRGVARADDLENFDFRLTFSAFC